MCIRDRIRPITCIENDSELIWNSDEIANAAARYAEASRQNIVSKGKAEHDFGFGNEGYKDNVLFTMRELQSVVPAAGDTAEGPDDIPYSIIRQLPDIAMAELLAPYNAIWTQGEYPKPLKEAMLSSFCRSERIP